MGDVKWHRGGQRHRKRVVRPGFGSGPNRKAGAGTVGNKTVNLVRPEFWGGGTRHGQGGRQESNFWPVVRDALGQVHSAKGVMVVGKSGPRRRVMGILPSPGPNPGIGDGMDHDVGRSIINVVNIPTLGPWNLRIASWDSVGVIRGVKVQAQLF